MAAGFEAEPLPAGPDPPPPILEEEPAEVESNVFVARERELAQLNAFLDTAMAGHGRVIFVMDEAGSGKTALVQEFAHRAQETHGDLIIAGGNCSAYTGVGDPYFPFREILERLTGDVEAEWAITVIWEKPRAGRLSSNSWTASPAG